MQRFAWHWEPPSALCVCNRPGCESPAIYQVDVEMFHWKSDICDSRDTGSSMSLELILWGPWTSVPNFTAVHLVFIETFH